MKLSVALKVALAYAAGLFCAYVTYVGANKLGTAVGKRLAPVVLPLLTSSSKARQTLGVFIVFGALISVSLGASEAIFATFMSVEELVSERLELEDWDGIDEIADTIFATIQRRRDLFTIQSRVFGTVPAILAALGFDAIHIVDVDDFPQGHDGPGDGGESATVH